MNNFTSLGSLETLQKYRNICGIDVSKLDLDCCMLDNQNSQIINQDNVSNTMNCIYEQFSSPMYDDTLFVLEYTGTYSSKLLYQLTELKRPVCVMSPSQSKNFMSILGHSNKSDKQAAYALSLAGRTLNLRQYKAPTKEMQERKQILSTLGALEKQKRMLGNQIHALEQLPFIEQQSINALKTVLESVNTQIAPLKKRLYDTSNDPNFNKKKVFATSVIGIGNKTAEAILLVTNGLDSFDNASKVAKFLGITPYSQQSGTSVKVKGRITKKGSHEVRSLLFMCAVSAIKHNLVCKELFQKMRKNNKPYKVAIIHIYF